MEEIASAGSAGPGPFSGRSCGSTSVLRGALVAAGLALLHNAGTLRAEQPLIAGLPPGKELIDLELEQLSNIIVTSVSRREERLSDAPASIFVITSEDIRRSGATSLPEALRLAPNLQVARADAAQYAISARGFYSANVLINKMLVLIDGRTVYSPLFSGVFWEAQQVMLEDVDRIEVISGPGSTEWGANAVNGIINVITKRAGDTQGTLVAAGGGNRESAVSVRYGGAIGETGHFRVYGTGGERNNSRLPNGTPLMDGLESGQAGFRADWNAASSNFALQGDVYRNDIEQAVGGSRDLAGANLIGRWNVALAPESRLHVQAYYDRTEREQPGAIRERLDTVDLEVHHGFRASERHRLLWGVGYRYMHDDLQNLTPVIRFVPDTRDLHRAHVFVQDTFALTPAVDLIGGLKFEHNDYTGWEFLPNVRLAWRLAPDRLLWGAVTRAVRTPARVDRELFIVGPPSIAVSGSTSFKSETVNVYEVGYRAQPTPALSYSVNAFHHDFDRLRTSEPRPGGTVFENGLNSRLNGVSAWGSWRVTPAWRLTTGGVWMRQRFSLDPGSASVGGVAAASPNDPKYWWQFSSSFNITARHEFDVRVRHVGESQGGVIPDYTAVDARIAWKARRDVELSLTAQNLFDPGHQEWGAPGVLPEVRRAWFAKLLWRM